MKFQRYEGNLILSPNPDSEWESLATTNPRASYDEASGKVYLLYRAAGNDPEHKIHLGLAISNDGDHFERVSETPVFSPSENGFDARCVEDLRIVKMGDYELRGYYNGELIGKANKEAIEAMQAAMMVAVVIPTIVTTTVTSS